MLLKFSVFVCFPGFTWFACDFGFHEPSFCRWSLEDNGFRWQIQTSGTPTLNTGPNMDHKGDAEKERTQIRNKYTLTIIYTKPFSDQRK